MKISYAITVCTELSEIHRLLKVLFLFKRKEDEIVVLFDSNNGTEEVWNYLLSVEKKIGVLNRLPFENNFGEWKNSLTKMCSGDYIYQIDADEMITPTALENLSYLLEMNPTVDVFLVPRINTVEGLTQEHIQKWGWKLNEKEWVNFPDYQWRIYRNDGKVKWKNKVHEVLEGYKIMSQLPPEEEYCLYHPKTIERQERQNEYYNTL